MFVIVNKANHAFFGVIFELCGNFEESSFVKIRVIGFVCQDRVVTPDDLFFLFFVRKKEDWFQFLFRKR